MVENQYTWFLYDPFKPRSLQKKFMAKITQRP